MNITISDTTVRILLAPSPRSLSHSPDLGCVGARRSYHSQRGETRIHILEAELKMDVGQTVNKLNVGSYLA